MTTRDHTSYQQEIGAYLLGALTDLERQAFEQHLESCAECREEVERLRPAAEALPRSVEQVEPPPGLRASIMEVVEREAREQSGKPSRRSLREWFAGKPMLLRPAFAVGAIALGLAVGFGVAQLGGDDTRSVGVTVAKAMPQAGGTLQIADDRATLELHDMPDLGGARVYQVWYQHGDRLVPTRTFEVGPNGRGEVGLPDVGDADGVYVTREARGGAQVPSEDPIVSVPL